MIIEGAGMNCNETAARGTENSKGLEALRRLMNLSSELVECSMGAYNTDDDRSNPPRLHNIADTLAEEIGVLAESLGYTVADVVGPMWAAPQS